MQLQESIINYIEIEENKKLEILKNKNNKWNYFNDLLYPYKNNKNKDIIKTEKCIDLLSFNYSNSIIYINDNINLSERLVCIQKNNITKIILSGSSLKFMMIVERKANIYYRLAPTMEWDTAAAHAILNGLNIPVKTVEGKNLVYNKENLLNPSFTAG